MLYIPQINRPNPLCRTKIAPFALNYESARINAPGYKAAACRRLSFTAWPEKKTSRYQSNMRTTERAPNSNKNMDKKLSTPSPQKKKKKKKESITIQEKTKINLILQSKLPKTVLRWCEMQLTNM